MPRPSSLKPTNSVGELKHRAAQYAKHLLPSQHDNHPSSSHSKPFTASQLRANTSDATIDTSIESSASAPQLAASSGIGGGAGTISPQQYQMFLMWQRQQQVLAQQSPQAQHQLRQAINPVATHQSSNTQPSTRRSLTSEDLLSDSDYTSDSDCSTCSTSSGTPRRDYSSSSAYSSRRSHHRHHHHVPHVHGEKDRAEDHADCFSCNSSCSCTSGCESDMGSKVSHGTQSVRSHTKRKSGSPSAVTGTVPLSRGPGSVVAGVGTAAGSAAVSGAASAIGANTQRSRRSVGSTHRSRRSATSTQAPAAPIELLDGASVVGPHSSAGEDSHVDGDEDEEDDDEDDGASLQDAAAMAAQDQMHVTFSTAHRKRDPSTAWGQKRGAVYESALQSISRAEQGFLSYVLTSEQATEQARNSVRNPNAVPPAASLLRKLIRYEPRRTLRTNEKSLSVASGSGNLVWYDLVLDGSNQLKRFPLSEEEQAEIEKLREMERKRDIEGNIHMTEDNPLRAAFSAERYEKLLQARKGIQLTIQRKAGIIPIRRIREMKSGIVPGATRLVNSVNDHFDEIDIAEDETIIAEHCVSVLLDSGVSSRSSTHRSGSSAAASSSVAVSAAAASVHKHHHTHDHEDCIACFDPMLCPRVHSSFEKASMAASSKLQKEIERNQKKHFGIHSQGQPEFAGGIIDPTASHAFNHSHSQHYNLHYPSHPAPSHASFGGGSSAYHSTISSSAIANWVVIVTNSREEAATLVNSLMFLKLMAGQIVKQKSEEEKAREREQREREVVTLPAPSPSKSPAYKKTKRAHGENGTLLAWQEQAPLEPSQLTSVLMNSAQQSANQDEQSAAASSLAQTQKSALRSSFLKRKSMPTPSVKAQFPMPAASGPLTSTDLASSQSKSRPSTAAIAPSAAASKKRKQPKSLAAQWVESVVACDEARSLALHPQSDARNQAASSHQSYDATHPLSTNTAIFIPNASVNSTFVAAGAAAAPASLDEWLERKKVAAEKQKRKEALKAQKVEEEKKKKQAESAAAFTKWQAKQRELDAEREIKKAKEVADKKRAEDEKAAAKALRKTQAVKAYNTFLERYEERKVAETTKGEEATKEKQVAARAKKREAKKRFNQWIRSKSQWYIDRVQAIKKRQAERRKRGDGNMDEEDEEEEAALDWKWLEKEVEAEILQAAQKKEGKKSKRATVEFAAASAAAAADVDEIDPLKMASDGRSEAEMLVDPESAASAEDQNLLYGVLDEVDMELWQKLMAGIESTRDELSRLKANQPASQVAQLDRDRPPSVRVTSPTPLISMRDPEAIRATAIGINGFDHRSTAVERSNAEAQTGSFDANEVVFSRKIHDEKWLSDSHGLTVSPIDQSFQRQSPFPTDARSVARESLLNQTPGTYSKLVDVRNGVGAVQSTSATSSAAAAAAAATYNAAVLPSSAQRPYSNWLRGEIQQALESRGTSYLPQPFLGASSSTPLSLHRQVYPVTVTVPSSQLNTSSQTGFNNSRTVYQATRSTTRRF